MMKITGYEKPKEAFIKGRVMSGSLIYQIVSKERVKHQDRRAAGVGGRAEGDLEIKMVQDGNMQLPILLVTMRA